MKGGQQSVRRESRSSSLLKTLTDQAPSKKKTEVVPHEVPVKSHKAPAPRPHTLDPFREVKEYISEANEYAVHLVDKIEVSLNNYVICSIEKISMNMTFIS